MSTRSSTRSHIRLALVMRDRAWLGQEPLVRPTYYLVELWYEYEYDGIIRLVHVLLNAVLCDTGTHFRALLLVLVLMLICVLVLFT